MNEVDARQEEEEEDGQKGGGDFIQIGEEALFKAERRV